MGNIYSEKTIGARIAERKLSPGDRLWIVGDKVTDGPLRQGNSPSNPGVYLRWKDLDIPKDGKIENEDLKKVVISPGQGLSLFIEKVVHSDFNLLSSQQGQCGKAALAKLAADKGYANSAQIHWFKIDDGRVVPVGLEIIFDNQPAGHCILTVTRAMTVHEFLNLVNDHLGFNYIGTDIFGKK